MKNFQLVSLFSALFLMNTLHCMEEKKAFFLQVKQENDIIFQQISNFELNEALFSRIKNYYNEIKDNPLLVHYFLHPLRQTINYYSAIDFEPHNLKYTILDWIDKEYKYGVRRGKFVKQKSIPEPQS